MEEHLDFICSGLLLVAATIGILVAVSAGIAAFVDLILPAMVAIGILWVAGYAYARDDWLRLASGSAALVLLLAFTWIVI